MSQLVSFAFLALFGQNWSDLVQNWSYFIPFSLNWSNIAISNLIDAKSCNTYVTYLVTSMEGRNCLITTKLVFQDRDEGYLFKLYCYMCVIEVAVLEKLPAPDFCLTQNSHAKNLF